jgi:type 1 fimbriae regulatory protein FimB/type 1 fimbriae regulatory protein FimE
MGNAHPGPAPIRQNNKARRGREWLEDREVMRMVRAAGQIGRYGDRDAAMILIAYRHGFRNSEACDLRWENVNLEGRELFAERTKGSTSCQHTMELDEIKALRKLPDTNRHVFINERGLPLSVRSFAIIVARAGKSAKLPIPVHPHMLRHACGRSMASHNVATRTIQDWLGHKSISNTEWYTSLDAGAFRRAGVWSWRKG